MFQGKCPCCGLSLSFWSVLKLYWHRFWEWFFKAASLRCPRCQFANPLNATTCGKCQAQLTVELATEQVLHPPRQRWLKFKREATPGTKRRIQWAYLVSSAALLWWLLAYVEDHGGHLWPLYMALSVVYVAVILFLMFWLVPRQVFLSVSRRATRLVKLALALNGFALMILMQLFIKEWWVRTLTLAGLFVVLWLGFRIFYQFILRSAAEAESIFLGNQPNTLDPTAPQGRTTRID
jgi:hypothetical protein